MRYIEAFSLSMSLVFSTNANAAISQSGADDEIDAQWKHRSEVASQRLSIDDLDECDKAIERAFKHPEETLANSVRRFKIGFDVAGVQLQVVYVFRNNQLEAFQMLNLPAGWVAWQRAENKTLSVFVPTAKCVVDICTNNPFGPSLCQGEKLE